MEGFAAGEEASFSSFAEAVGCGFGVIRDAGAQPCQEAVFADGRN
jgi:hypothetical protein